LSWTAPANGGSPITSYAVTPYAGARRLATRIVSGTSAAIEGLRDGASYRFTVAARNALGTGPASARTGAVRPSSVLGPASALLPGSWCSPALLAAERWDAQPAV
jgi:hypothetical protein